MDNKQIELPARSKSLRSEAARLIQNFVAYNEVPPSLREPEPFPDAHQLRLPRRRTSSVSFAAGRPSLAGSLQPGAAVHISPAVCLPVQQNGGPSGDSRPVLGTGLQTAAEPLDPNDSDETLAYYGLRRSLSPA